MDILKVENLKKIYGSGEARVEALKGVSFAMRRGEFGAVVGASGSGKSTLLNCIGGLDEPDGGKVLINDKNLFGMGENERTIFRRRNIGFIFQSFHLIPELDVEQNILFPLLLDYRKPDKAQAEEMLEVLGLENRRRHLPGQLSGGQQQRVAIARALVTKPAIILADEPTGNLDSKTTQEVLGLLKLTGEQFHQTIVMITHNEALAQLCGRVIHIEDGKIMDDCHASAFSQNAAEKAAGGVSDEE